MRPDFSLRTERLLLRPLARGDAAGLVAGLGDFEVARWLARVPFPYTLAEAERFLAWERAERRAGAERVVAIDREGIIGIVSLRSFGPAPVLGYWMARAHWGQGYMTEAVAAVLAAAFADPRVGEIRSGVFDGNERSLAVQNRFGFTICGRSRVHNLALQRDLAHIDTILTRARHRDPTS